MESPEEDVKTAALLYLQSVLPKLHAKVEGRRSRLAVATSAIAHKCGSVKSQLNRLQLEAESSLHKRAGVATLQSMADELQKLEAQLEKAESQEERQCLCRLIEQKSPQWAAMLNQREPSFELEKTSAAQLDELSNLANQIADQGILLKKDRRRGSVHMESPTPGTDGRNGAGSPGLDIKPPVANGVPVECAALSPEQQDGVSPAPAAKKLCSETDSPARVIEDDVLLIDSDDAEDRFTPSPDLNAAGPSTAGTEPTTNSSGWVAASPSQVQQVTRRIDRVRLSHLPDDSLAGHLQQLSMDEADLPQQPVQQAQAASFSAGYMRQVRDQTQPAVPVEVAHKLVEQGLSDLLIEKRRQPSSGGMTVTIGSGRHRTLSASSSSTWRSVEVISPAPSGCSGTAQHDVGHIPLPPGIAPPPGLPPVRPGRLPSATIRSSLVLPPPPTPPSPCLPPPRTVLAQPQPPPFAAASAPHTHYTQTTEPSTSDVSTTELDLSIVKPEPELIDLTNNSTDSAPTARLALVNRRPNLRLLLQKSPKKGLRCRLVRTIKNNFNGPIGCAYNDDRGQWVICDTKNHQVKVYDRRFQLRQTIGRRLSANKHLVCPSAVIFSTDLENFAVKDDHAVYLFSSESFEFVGEIELPVRTKLIGLSGSFEDSATDDIECIITLQDGFNGGQAIVSIVDPNSKQVQKKMPYQGASEVNDRYSSRPRFMDWHSNGILAISDLGVHAVFIVSTFDGSVLHTIGQPGKPGSKPGQLNFPSGVRHDCEGNLLVGDAKNNRVQLFDDTGVHLCVLDFDREDGSTSPYFPFPSDIHLTNDAHLMVMSRGQNFCAVYKIEPKK